MTRVDARLGLAVLVLVAAGSAAVASAAPAPAPPDATPQEIGEVLRAAAEQALDSGGVQVAATAELTSPEGSASAVVTGRLDPAGDEAQGRAEIVGDGREVTGHGREVTVELVAIGERAWVRAEGVPMADAVLGGDRWLLLDGAELPDDRPAPPEPAELLDALQASISEDSRVLGTEDVDGVTATRYRIEVDPQVLAERAQALLELPASALERSPDDLAGQLDDHATTDVWIAEDGSLRRVLVLLDHGPADARVEVTYDAWGVEVDVTPPPADDVIDLAQVLPDDVDLGRLLGRD